MTFEIDRGRQRSWRGWDVRGVGPISMPVTVAGRGQSGSCRCWWRTDGIGSGPPCWRWSAAHTTSPGGCRARGHGGSTRCLWPELRAWPRDGPGRAWGSDGGGSVRPCQRGGGLGLEGTGLAAMLEGSFLCGFQAGAATRKDGIALARSATRAGGCRSANGWRDRRRPVEAARE